MQNMEVQKRNELAALFNTNKIQNMIKAVLPSVLTPQRFIQVGLTATLKNPRLLDCTAVSFTNSMLKCAETGLEPDGRRAALVPYGQECTLQLMYQGYIELLMETGDVINIHAEIVHENDDFEYDMGTVKRHKINFKSERGEPFACWCKIELKNGAVKFEVMTKEQIYEVRNKSSAYKNNKPTPWTDPQAELEMWKKTVFLRARKWVSLRPENRKRIEAAEDIEAKEINVTPEKHSESNPKIGISAPPDEYSQPDAEDEVPMEYPENPVEKKPESNKNRNALKAFVEGTGVSFEAFRNALGNDTWGGWDEIPSAEIERLAKDVKALGAAIKVAKGGK